MAKFKKIHLHGTTFKPKYLYVLSNSIREGSLIDTQAKGPFYGGRYNVLKVIGFQKDKLFVEPFPFPLEMREGIFAVTPLEINDYWLEKLGFKPVKYNVKDDYPSYHLIKINDRFFLKVKHNSYKIGNEHNYRVSLIDTDDPEQYEEDTLEVHLKSISHVHVLQNLYFALTGMELLPGVGIDDIIERIDDFDVPECKWLYKRLKTEYGITDIKDFEYLEQYILKRINFLLNDWDYIMDHMDDDQ